jgi:hypothetical protein
VKLVLFKYLLSKVVAEGLKSNSFEFLKSVLKSLLLLINRFLETGFAQTLNILLVVKLFADE